MIRHALITGGSSGIGFELARQIVRNGTSVSILARRPEKLAEAEKALRPLADAHGARVLTYSVDVSDRKACESACQIASDALGVPDLTILNAGQARPGYFEEMTPDVFETMMAVNYFGVLWCARALAPAMTMRGNGHIVFVASGAALVGLFGYTAYAPSKFAVRGLAESLRGELKPKGVNVSIVYPPDTETPQLEQENRTKPAETKAITASGGVMSAEAVARAILKGIARNRFAIAPGFEMSALERLHSLLAPGLRWHFDRLCKAARLHR